jgi:hypothetical protein
LTAAVQPATLPPVTADADAIVAASDPIDMSADADADTGPLYCYRHPKNETYVRCGRCDQPICPKCAVQGPVGFRCRECGLVKSAAVTDFTARQLALGLAIPLGGGAILGYLGGQVGFYSIFIAFFAGAFIAEAFVRFVGLKRGPIVRTMLYGGLVAGFAVGAVVQISTFASAFVGEADVPFEVWLQTMLPYIAIGVGALVAGAYSRVRWF